MNIIDSTVIFWTTLTIIGACMLFWIARREALSEAEGLAGVIVVVGAVLAVIGGLGSIVTATYNYQRSQPDQRVEVILVKEGGRGLVAVDDKGDDYRISLEVSRQVDDGKTRCQTEGTTDRIYKCK